MMLYRWLLSRRLQLLATTIFCYAALMSLLRILFYFRFSGIENTSSPIRSEVLEIFYIGFKFDIRVAILICLPLIVLSVIPRVNLFRYPTLKVGSQIILAVFTIPWSCSMCLILATTVIWD